MTSAVFDLSAYLAGRLAPVEAALERAVSGLEGLLPPYVASAVRHGVMGGGKRLRPILCMAAYEAGGGRASDDAWDLAASLELIHAYSLMHDDLPCMDDAELRRGRPTTHRVHGQDRTMRAGAALIPAAALQARRAALALGRDEAEASEVAGTVLRAAGAGGMVGGQWLDLEGEGQRLDEAGLDALHRLKTGALLVASLTVGALAAGASPRRRQALEDYGRAVGLAFQVADDILDATSDAAVLGKNPSDTALDKSTYEGELGKRLRHPNVAAIHGLEEAGRRAASLVEEARRSLAAGDVDAPPLDALAEYVVARRN